MKKNFSILKSTLLLAVVVTVLFAFSLVAHADDGQNNRDAGVFSVEYLETLSAYDLIRC